ncbi:TauD/TfdA family dioxygenase [Mumia zhuanghuii]|uniref:TauD/TfdA family dioxygenase n=1 Tax=Mumia zhuanghuii TaxID=2585211 RepID=A0A5C4MNU4_9ACTN|nr:TauD/TfdA family dioxygenase [Mumia zhuanghuii]TNC51032.1 TauD/TfdA family dioxygenase [Mumia zhuanghuii]
MQVSGHMSDLASKGWTSTDNESTFAELAATLGGSEVRRQVLRPVRMLDARQGTHSALAGLGTFPWHTDGSIALTPPRWMVLRCLEVTRPTSTEFCLPDGNLRRALGQLTLLIRQENGRKAYVPAMVKSSIEHYRIRWDPRARILGPDAARSAVEGAEPSDAVSWRKGRVIVVDNHRVLHRRPAVVATDGRVMMRTFLVS